MSSTPYDRLGRGYSHVRRPDPRIAAQIDAALGEARTALNVGAGRRCGQSRGLPSLDVGLRLVSVPCAD